MTVIGQVKEQLIEQGEFDELLDPEKTYGFIPGYGIVALEDYA